MLRFKTSREINFTCSETHRISLLSTKQFLQKVWNVSPFLADPCCVVLDGPFWFILAQDIAEVITGEHHTKLLWNAMTPDHCKGSFCSTQINEHCLCLTLSLSFLFKSHLFTYSDILFPALWEHTWICSNGWLMVQEIVLINQQAMIKGWCSSFTRPKDPYSSSWNLFLKNKDLCWFFDFPVYTTLLAALTVPADDAAVISGNTGVLCRAEAQNTYWVCTVSPGLSQQVKEASPYDLISCPSAARHQQTQRFVFSGSVPRVVWILPCLWKAWFCRTGCGHPCIADKGQCCSFKRVEWIFQRIGSFSFFFNQFSLMHLLVPGWGV